jgi:hypothetical protein
MLPVTWNLFLKTKFVLVSNGFSGISFVYEYTLCGFFAFVWQSILGFVLMRRVLPFVCRYFSLGKIMFVC